MKQRVCPLILDLWGIYVAVINTGVPETPDGFLNLKPACLLCGTSILTVIMHSAVWSLDDMGMYLF
jgi:hypothetical protein